MYDREKDIHYLQYKSEIDICRSGDLDKVLDLWCLSSNHDFLYYAMIDLIWMENTPMHVFKVLADNYDYFWSCEELTILRDAAEANNLPVADFLSTGRHGLCYGYNGSRNYRPYYDLENIPYVHDIDDYTINSMCRDNHLDMLKFLVARYKRKIDSESFLFFTMQFNYSKKDNLPLIKYLIEEGNLSTDKDIVNRVIKYAIDLQREDIIQYLLQQGCSLSDIPVKQRSRWFAKKYSEFTEKYLLCRVARCKNIPTAIEGMIKGYLV